MAAHTSDVIYCIAHVTQVYPVYSHWDWSYHGWLSAENENAILGRGSIDCAGSGEDR